MLTKAHADILIEKASSLATMQSYGHGYRFGQGKPFWQSLFNILPPALYQELTNSSDDFFYERDVDVVLEEFYRRCVDNGKTV